MAIWIRAPKLHDLANPEARDTVLLHLSLWQTWWPLKFDGFTANGSPFHVSWSISTECALYLLFGLGAIVLTSLPRRRGLPTIVATTFFFATTIVLFSASGWLRDSLAPDWSNRD